MPSRSPQDLVQIAKAYLRAIQEGEPFEVLSSFFAPDCVQEEFPNRLVPNGARRNLDDLRVAALRGNKVVERQRYEVLHSVAQDAFVALEVHWSARLLVPFGSLKAGDTLKARFAIFLSFQDGLIVRQHNYDCFDPF
jgi:ketosteroid isomerase-like protein